VSGLNGVTAIAAGGDFGLALLRNGTAMAWGGNIGGELGDGISGISAEFSDVPVPVSGLSGATAISAGNDFSLALLRNGTIMGWGFNAAGQLGDGNDGSSDVPVPVSGLSGATAISAGNEFSLALLANGTAMAWGDNEGGQLGDGTSTDVDRLPVAVSGLSRATAISAGSSFSLALESPERQRSHRHRRYGRQGYGQLPPEPPAPCSRCLH
jgi:alpha-tubulin suppressor-like RCC1 family protein